MTQVNFFYVIKIKQYPQQTHTPAGVIQSTF